MAAPTNVAVEALSITSVRITWTYPGTNLVYVYRSTDDVSYTRISSAEEVAVGTTRYTDIILEPGTKYWYKLSDDNGVTFSSVVTVFTHTCGVSPVQVSDVILPRFGNGEEWHPEIFNDLSVRVETGLVRFTDPNGRICVACINDGALVLDCINYNNCDTIQVKVDQNINSISLPNCVNTIIDIEFFIPANSNFTIRGWPNGMGNGPNGAGSLPSITTGNRPKKLNATVSCKCADMSGGAVGVTPGFNCLCEFDLRRPPGTTTTSKSGAAPSTGCNCVPNGGLTIKACTPGNSLSCSTSKSLTLKVCGGIGPYTWDNTGNVVLSSSSGVQIIVTPPTNSGSAVIGNAYATGTWHRCNGGFNQTHRAAFGCDDQVTSALAVTLANENLLTAEPSCEGVLTGGSFIIPIVDHSNPACSPNCDGCPNPALSNPPGSNACDMRSALMISAGCNPCGLQSSSTVSVTDALGTVTTIILRA